MFLLSSSSTGGNTEQSTSSSDRSFQVEHRSTDDDGCSEDGSSAPSPSFQLPMYLSSPSSLPNRRQSSSASKRTSSSSSSGSSGSSNHSPSIDQEEQMAVQRLVMLAKYPNANEAQVQQTLQKQQRKEELVSALAMKKGQQFRQQQQMHQDQQSRRLEETPRNLKPLIEESSSEEVELDERKHCLHQTVFQKPIWPSTKGNPSSSRNSRSVSKNDVDDSASFVVWQAAGQGTGERFYRGIPGPQRITFQEDLTHHQANPREQPVHRGIMKLVVSIFGKIFPTEAPPPPTSSGASILSDSMDGRSVNTANKSLASKASLPSYCSEQTRKINNLTQKDKTGISNMNSIEEDSRGDGRSGFRRLISTRIRAIILVLCLVLVVAVIVTVAAAFNGGKRVRKQQDNAITGHDAFPGPAPTQSLGVAIPTLAPKENLPTTTSAPTMLNGSMAVSGPTQLPISTTSQPSTLVPTFSPTSPPSFSPSASPTLDNFSEWTWTQRGLSFQGNETGERYGQSVAISDDGKILAVGAPYSTVDGKALAGTVRVFQWDDNDRRRWVPYGFLQGRNEGDQFGNKIALSADGSVIAVSEPTYRGMSGDRSGNVRVFIHNPFNGFSPLGQELEGVDATDHFGIGLSISGDGRRIAVGAPYHDNTGISGSNGNGYNSDRLVSGHARVFEWSSEDSSWVPIGNPLTGMHHLDWFGWSVDLNENGSVVCVGAPRNLQYGGYVKCYEDDAGYVDTDWKLMGSFIENIPIPLRYDDNFGAAIKVSWDPSVTKHRVAIGSPGKNRDAIDAGVAIVYEYDPTEASTGWVQLGQAIVSPSPGQSNQLGTSIDLRGDLLAVGVPGTGEVNLFRFQSETNEWERHPRTLQGLSGSNFGAAVRLTPYGDIAVGSPQTDDADDVGTVNVYKAGRS